jgi:hypothetical protein
MEVRMVQKTELERRETCMSNYDHGGLRVIHLDIKSKALLIGRIFRFLDVNHEACPWQVLMRYYVARPLGINDNTKPNCDIPSPFYSHLLRVLKEFSVDLSQPQPSKFYYTCRLQNCVSPVQTRSEVHWNRRFGPGVIWKDVWKEIARNMNDPVLRDFDWRTVHRILPVNSRMHQWNSRLPSRCARCGAQVETLEHVLVDCPKIKDMWMFILNLCHRIDPSVIGLSEKNLFLGCFSQQVTKDLLR